MNGLVTPRGLAFGPDGGLYVAEAGSGGSGPSVVLGNGNTASLGTTSSVSRLLGGVQTRVLSDLPSVATAAGLDAGGLQDIVFDGTGQAFSFGSDVTQRNNNLGAAGSQLGTIARLPLDKPRRSTFHLPSAPAAPLSTLRAKLTPGTMGRRCHFYTRSRQRKL